MDEVFRIERPEWTFQMLPTNRDSDSMWFKVILDLRDKDLYFPFEPTRSEQTTGKMTRKVVVTVDSGLRLDSHEFDKLEEEPHHGDRDRRYTCSANFRATTMFSKRSSQWDQVKVSVKYQMFWPGRQVVRFTSHDTPSEIGAESNWQEFMNGIFTDVTILTKDGEIVRCHREHLSRGSRVLHKQLERPFPKPGMPLIAHPRFAILMKELTRTQVVAFLRYQYSGNTDKILESPGTSLLILKEAERFQVGSMWDDTISALLLKNSDWFELDSLVDFKYYLETCSRRQEFYPRELVQKLYKRLMESTSKIYMTKHMITCEDSCKIIDNEIKRGQFQKEGIICQPEFGLYENSYDSFLCSLTLKNFASHRMMSQVKLWFSKREWNVKITAENKVIQTQMGQPTPRMNDTATGSWVLNLELRSNDFNHQYRQPKKQHRSKKTKQIPAEIEVHLQIGDYNIIFNNMVQTICEDWDGRFHQDSNVTSAKVINQLRTISNNRIGITVFASHRNVEPNSHVKSLDDLSPHIIEEKWKDYLHQDPKYSSNVTILAKNGEVINCDPSSFARNSRVLRESDEDVFKMQDLTRAQVEAFLRYQYCGTTDKIMESPLTSLMVLKEAERYDINNMWSDTLKALRLKNSDWFEGSVLPEFKNYLDSCTKRYEFLTEQLRMKLSQLLEQSIEDRKETSGITESIERRCEELDKILESPMSALRILKVAECYKHDIMWANIISALLLKDSDWFAGNFEELINFLASCSKRDEEATQNLVLKISQLQEQSNQSIEQTAGIVEHANQIENIDDGQQTSDNMGRKTNRRKFAKKSNSSSVAQESCSSVEALTSSTESVPNARRSSRLKVQKQIPGQKRGLHQDETWQEALVCAAKRKGPATWSGKAVYGPRDIQKDPALPKIAIFPDPEVKVEKVEPAEESSEETTMDTVAAECHFIPLEDPDSDTGAASFFGFVKLEKDN